MAENNGGRLPEVRGDREIAETGKGDVLRVGLDIGSNTSVFVAAQGDRKVEYEDAIVPTVVGYPKTGTLPGILPKGISPHFGNEAIRYRLHLDLTWPIKYGLVDNLAIARDFISDLRDKIDPEGNRQLWVVVGSPANAQQEKLKDIRAVCGGSFDRILIVPEPFLAAMGYREEERIDDPAYTDPTRNSLFVDIGAGTTDLCKIQGYYPTSHDLISIPKAGNDVDEVLAGAINKIYPDANLTPIAITAIKERHSFVGDISSRIMVKVPIAGKPKELDLTQPIKQACEFLLDVVIDSIGELAARCDADSVEELLGNIVLTGGGSQIRNIDKVLEARIRAEGYESARVRKVADYRTLVAKGALKIARRVKDDQWQILI